MKDNIVSIKGRSDGIIEVRLAGDVPYKKIREDFIIKLNATKSFLHGANPSVIVWGRQMAEKQKTEFKYILDRDYDIMNVKFQDELDDVEQSFIDKALLDTPKVKPNKAIFSDFRDEKKMMKKGKTKRAVPIFIRGTVRNGQKIEADGDLTIVGDVNAGAEVFAVGNIVIFGQLRGLVHAGCHGDEKCIVSALKMTPNQIRIASRIVAFPKNRKPKKPEIAQIEDENIIVINAFK